MGEFLDINIEGFRIDKSSWSLVKFGDIATQQKKAVDRDNTELIRYVKGEHMGSEDLHLREWGELTDEYLGPAFIRIFEEGDILYGSRRTYLRKVVIAPFSGITSNTTFVIKANEKKIDKRLLPFVMMSEGFTEHSIKNSKGSVNPYINWKDIANYEFLLPPKDQQAKLAELLWGMDAVISTKEKSIEKCKVFKEIFFENTLLENNSSKPITETTLAEISEKSKYSCVGGPFGSNLTSKHYIEKPGIPVIRGNNLSQGETRFIDAGFIYVSEEKAKTLKQNTAYRGDILYTQRGTLGQVGIIPSHSLFDRYIISQSQMKLTVDRKKAIPDYIYHYLLSKRAKSHLKIVTISTGVPHINLGIFKEYPILLPDISKQRIIVDNIALIDEAINLHNKHISISKSLQKSLINQIF